MAKKPEEPLGLDRAMSLSQITLSVGAWAKGIPSESEFWTRWVQTRGGQWPDDFAGRLDHQRQLDRSLAQLLPRGGAAKVLDVGAGPMTILGSMNDGKRVEITAVDPLASLYASILDRAHIAPPVATQFANAEDLSAFFSASQFDLVHCRNALDHSFDPVRGIEEMLRVLKVGGYLVLRHFVNEAESEKYSGFHQFNFCCKNEKFCIWNKDGEFIPSERFAGIGDFFAAMKPEHNYVEFIVKKTSEFSDAEIDSRYRIRIRDVMRGLIEYFVSLTE